MDWISDLRGRVTFHENLKLKFSVWSEIEFIYADPESESHLRIPSSSFDRTRVFCRVAFFHFNCSLSPLETVLFTQNISYQKGKKRQKRTVPIIYWTFLLVIIIKHTSAMKFPIPTTACWQQYLVIKVLSKPSIKEHFIFSNRHSSMPFLLKKSMPTLYSSSVTFRQTPAKVQ